MAKLLDCPVCLKKGQPVRDDAKVCSPACRLKKWRLNKKQALYSPRRELKGEE